MIIDNIKKSVLKNLNINTILNVVLVIVILLYLKQCNTTSNLSDDLKISKMNQIALNDSIRSYEIKNGSLVYQKQILIASKKELKDLNLDLSKELKGIKNNPKIIIKKEISIVHDTLKVPTYIVKYTDGNTGLTWKTDTTYSEGNYQTLSGETRFKLDSAGHIINSPVTYINENKIGISLTTGLVSDKEGYKIFIKSDYPGFTPTKIEGAIIDKKMIISNESPVVFGPSIGYGLVFASGGQVRHGLSLGFMATYNLNKPIKKLFRPHGL